MVLEKRKETRSTVQAHKISDINQALICVYMVTAVLLVASSQVVLEKYTVEMNCARKKREKKSEICKDNNVETETFIPNSCLSKHNTHNIRPNARHRLQQSQYVHDKEYVKQSLLKALTMNPSYSLWPVAPYVLCIVA